MKKQKKLSKPIAELTVAKVQKTMKRNSSSKTGNISIKRLEIAEKTGLSPRTVDAAVQALKIKKVITRVGHGYKFC